MDIPTDDSEYSQYLEQNFDTKKFVDNWFLHTIYTEMYVGDPITPIEAEMFKNITALTMIFANNFQKEKNLNYFNVSKSIQGANTIQRFEDYTTVQWYGTISDDFYFYFSPNQYSTEAEQKKLNMEFNVNCEIELEEITQVDDISLKEVNETTSFGLAIKIDNDYDSEKSSNFLRVFKEKDLISSYDLKFEFYNEPTLDPYNDNDPVGTLMIGKFEELYNTSKFPAKNLRNTKLISSSYSIDYRIFMTETYMETSSKASEPKKRTPIKSQNIEFVFDESLISGIKEYKTLIDQEFFSKYEGGKMCELETVNSRDASYRDSKVDVFVCDKNLVAKHKNDFPILKFYSSDLDFTFEFGYDDLFKEYRGGVYFLVIFPVYKKDQFDW